MDKFKDVTAKALYELYSISRIRYSCPKRFKSNHILLASFPKSGNTWFRFIVSNVSRILVGSDEEVTFHSIDHYSPFVGKKNLEFNRLIDDGKNPVFIKTHYPWNKKLILYPTVLVIRNPADVMVSYYMAFKKGAKKELPEISEFIKHWRYGIPAWVNFHQTWIDKYTTIIRYENILNDPRKTLSEMFFNLGYHIDEDIIDKALFRSSKDNMRRLRQIYGDPHALNIKFQFVRKAISGEGKKYLSTDDLFYINRQTKFLPPEMRYKM